MFCPYCAAPFASTADRVQRKIVTVLFCDVVGSTAFGELVDAEAVRSLLALFFVQMKAIVEAHGGVVDKFIGDAVMAIFGVPVVHEDDALRALRAAQEMRRAVPELGLQGRIGVNSGEVVTGTAERLATGDAVNVAARLQQAAEPGQVLLGAATLQLVRDAVDAAPIGPLVLKGKSEPVPAWRLLSLRDWAERPSSARMIGRESELARLRAAVDRAVDERSCQLFTILGSAGVGKSRLAAEFLASVDAHVVRGRCLSYGEGITYWPVVEVVKLLDAIPADKVAASAIRSLLGKGESETNAETIAWAFRKLLEQEAQKQPVVCVLDDLHWGEETFLDLVEEVGDLAREAPILLLCMSRPELLQRRPGWGSGKLNTTTALLQPLDDVESDRLLNELGGFDASAQKGKRAPTRLREQIRFAAEGNPLFLGEMLALVRGSGGSEVKVPPTIQALLAARLDQLDPAERSVLERAAVAGRVFHQSAVHALCEGEQHMAARLVALVRQELIEPHPAQIPGEDAYRFRHQLIRDAAYDAAPKAVRIELHERFADWLETHARPHMIELDELLAYHLEQAVRYQAELGRPEPALAAAAATRLAAAGRRANTRGDRRAAESLLGRAVALDNSQDVHLLVDFARCLVDLPAAVGMLEDAAFAADAGGDLAGAALARAIAAERRTWAGRGSVDEQERLAQAALPVLEAAGDHQGLAALWLSFADGVYNVRCQYAQMEHAAEQQRRHALLAGLPPSHQVSLSTALVYGACPVEEALRRLDGLVADDANPWLDLSRAVLLAMSGRFEAALALAQPAAEHARELGFPARPELAEIEALAGNLEAAAERLRVYCDWLDQRGQTAPVSTYSAERGRLLCELGRPNEAERLAQESRELADEDDPVTQALWRQVAALVHASRGETAEAERLAREAVARSELTDSTQTQGDALCDLGAVLEAAGRQGAAADAYRGALECYERKRIVPLARRVRERLVALERCPQHAEAPPRRDLDGRNT